MATSESSTGGPRRSSLPLNEVRRVDGGERGEPSRDIPDALRPHYHQDGNAFRSAHRPDKIEWVDRGHRMHAYRPVSTFTARALASTAQLRGWSEAQITGDKKFQSQAYVELESKGISVKGYQPTEKDQEILQKRAERAAAKENPVVKAFLDASDKRAQTAAAKKHPELKEAFALKAAVTKMAEQIPDAKGRENFQGMMMDRVCLALHRGEPMPEVKLRDAPAQQAEAQSQGR